MEGQIQQIKLSTGDEIICQIVEWADQGGGVEVLLVRDVLQMIPVEFYDDLEPEKATYILKPYLTYTDDLGKVIVINPIATVAYGDPSPAVFKQYLSSVEQIKDALKKENGEEEEIPVIKNVVNFRPKGSPKLLTEDWKIILSVYNIML